MHVRRRSGAIPVRNVGSNPARRGSTATTVTTFGSISPTLNRAEPAQLEAALVESQRSRPYRVRAGWSFELGKRGIGPLPTLPVIAAMPRPV
jgi:hypothetical protein